MPNWTTNTIRIAGPKASIDRLLNEAKPNKAGELTFVSWLDYPETFIKYDTTNHPDGKGLEVGKPIGWEKDSPICTEEMIEEYKKATQEQRAKYGVVGWYDFNRGYFGCKWNCEVELGRRGEEELEMYCETPWSAPDGFLLQMSKKYPDLHFANHAIYEDGYWAEFEYEGGSGDMVDSGEMEYDFEGEDE